MSTLFPNKRFAHIHFSFTQRKSPPYLLHSPLETLPTSKTTTNTSFLPLLQIRTQARKHKLPYKNPPDQQTQTVPEHIISHYPSTRTSHIGLSHPPPFFLSLFFQRKPPPLPAYQLNPTQSNSIHLPPSFNSIPAQTPRTQLERKKKKKQKKRGPPFPSLPFPRSRSPPCKYLVRSTVILFKFKLN